MSKAFVARLLQETAGLTGVAAAETTNALLEGIAKELKKQGRFTLPTFGSLRVVKTKARKALNPRTGEAIKVKAGRTVRFKTSPVLRKSVAGR